MLRHYGHLHFFFLRPVHFGRLMCTVPFSTVDGALDFSNLSLYHIVVQAFHDFGFVRKRFLHPFP